MSINSIWKPKHTIDSLAKVMEKLETEVSDLKRQMEDLGRTQEEFFAAMTKRMEALEAADRKADIELGEMEQRLLVRIEELEGEPSEDASSPTETSVVPGYVRWSERKAKRAAAVSNPQALIERMLKKEPPAAEEEF